MYRVVLLFLVLILVSCSAVMAGCPVGDLTGDCDVNYEDFSLFAEQWLTSGVSADGLVAYWQFNETEGTVAHDSSGMGNDGSLQGGFSFTSNGCAGRSGQPTGALRFNGLSDWINAGHDLSLDCFPHITIAAWVKVPGPGKNYETLVSKEKRIVTGSNYRAYTLMVHSDQSVMSWMANEDYPSYAGNTTGTPGGVSTGVWHHIAVTHDGTGITLYLDGIQDGRKVTMSGLQSSYPADLFIAKSVPEFGGGRFWAGDVDEIAIWNRTLSGQEIAMLYSQSILNCTDNRCGDFNGDGTIDLLDMGYLAGNWLENWTNAVRVTIAPQAAINAGGQWKIDGGPWQPSGATVEDLTVGTHRIDFSEISNWYKAGSRMVTILENQTTQVTGTYTDTAGSVQVNIQPREAVDAGGQWRVDQGVWRNTGEVQGNLSTGPHLIDFKAIADWSKPGWQAVQVQSNQIAQAAGTYLPGGIVMNEIHYDPDVKTELAEFIELYNTTGDSIDLSGWSFCNGVSYAFPAGTLLAGGDYLVVAQNPSVIASKFGVASEKIYGPYEGKLKNEGEKLELCNNEGLEVDQVEYQLGFPWPIVGDSLTYDGSGAAIQLAHPFLDNDLGGSWRSAFPTPGAQNSVYAENMPPQIRQVKHSPQEPHSAEGVAITAKVTDPDGVAGVILSYQLVDPGNYIRYQYTESGSNTRLIDPAYEMNWVDVAMHDDGQNGDLIAGDDVYSVQLPGAMQIHRRLVRYRITVTDTAALSVRVPYADDPQPNFAYFVFDGVPAWSGAIQPGSDDPAQAEVVEYGPEVMDSLPVYQLLAKADDIQQWQFDYIDPASPAAGWYQWSGTLVYDGVVYDNIWYRVRGWWSAYRWGKNKWKFDFNRGHYFQARDDYGQKYQQKWDKMNFSFCLSMWDYNGNYRGDEGMFEAVGFKLFNLAGVPGCHTNWIHYRVIDSAGETGPTQYDGDFWGLYMAVEQPDGNFLDEHGLPDGNVYKMGGTGPNKTNQCTTQVTDGSDLSSFRNSYPGYSAEQWQANADLESYYTFRALVHGLHHYDLNDGWNCIYYHNSETNQWSLLPWDIDLSWNDGAWNNGGVIWEQVLNFPDYQIGYRNRVRELRDLLFNTGQGWQLIDEYAALITDPNGGPSFINANRAMWDWNPLLNTIGRGYPINPYPSEVDLRGKYYQNPNLVTPDFAGMVQMMKDYIKPTGGGGARLDSMAYDPAIPDTPAITATGDPAFPANNLTFQTSPFSDPQGSGTFGAMQWRLGQVEASARIAAAPAGGELIAAGTEWKYFKGSAEPSATPGLWRTLGFNDDPGSSNWLTGNAAIGYGESFIVTNLDDMRYNYTTVYLRKVFTVTADTLDTIDSLKLLVKYDDGINVWINGVHVEGENVPGAELAYYEIANTSIENTGFVEFILPNAAEYLEAGDNIIAVQLLNRSLTESTDAFFDASLSAMAGTSDQSVNYFTRPGKYEITPVWETEEMPAYQNSITIPAAAVEEGKTYRVRCRMKDNTGRWSHWSPPIQFTAGQPLSAYILENLRITEMMYNPAPPDLAAGELNLDNNEFEFIELKNTGQDSIDLTYASFTSGITFAFGSGSLTALAPGEFTLVVRNQAAFESRYGTQGSTHIAGTYSGKLSNTGEIIRLEDTWNGVIVEYTYQTGRLWPPAADGAGHSLVPLASALAAEPDGSLNYGGNWRMSSYLGGSPGQDDIPLAPTVVLNELMAHTDYSDPAHPQYDSNDWIELYNTTAAALPLTDWYLSDDSNSLQKWAIPGTLLAGLSRASFDEVNDFHNPITSGFGLNKAGETLFLSYLPGDGSDRVVDAVQFAGQDQSVSLGRYPDGGAYWQTMPPSRDGSNQTPLQSVVIDEIMYHPLDSEEEYLELYNPTAAAIVLENAVGTWHLAGGITYTFPAGLSLAPYERILIVGFDPLVDAARLSSFQNSYNPGGILILGPWSGSLANEGERLALEKPQAPDQAGDPVSWIIQDEAIYFDQTPWPASPDGSGDSLQRTTPALSGNNPANWTATPPTPGY